MMRPLIAYTYRAAVRLPLTAERMPLTERLMRLAQCSDKNRSLTVAAPIDAHGFTPSRDRQGAPMGLRPTQGDEDAAEQWLD